MKPFRDLPIQQKMLVMTLLICGAVLCVAITALFGFQVWNFHDNFQRDAATLAAVKRVRRLFRIRFFRISRHMVSNFLVRAECAFPPHRTPGSATGNT